jgi:hypothetical protein
LINKIILAKAFYLVRNIKTVCRLI